jgi:hypothetical protein
MSCKSNFSTASDEEIDISASSKTAMICKLIQVPPEIWMTLPTEAKKWLWNERKYQQQGDDKLKKLSSTKDTIKVPEKDRSNSNTSSIPNLFHLFKQLGMKMISRNVVWYRMQIMLEWLILSLKHELTTLCYSFNLISLSL